ncbi:hypothetical protein C2W64_00350 [Brevibacillus laterosporus]|nr:hypothetical protein C2W64_00350 [Brevibacillus laterosporus]
MLSEYVYLLVGLVSQPIPYSQFDLFAALLTTVAVVVGFLIALF